MGIFPRSVASELESKALDFADLGQRASGSLGERSCEEDGRAGDGSGPAQAERHDQEIRMHLKIFCCIL